MTRSIDCRIKTFESDHNLEGEERLDLNKRHTWTRMCNDMTAWDTTIVEVESRIILH